MSGATSPIPLYLQALSTACSRCVAPFPQGMRLNIEQCARPKPEPLPRRVGVLACRLTHRPGASSRLPQAPDPRPENPSAQSPPTSAHIRPFPTIKNMNEAPKGKIGRLPVPPGAVSSGFRRPRAHRHCPHQPKARRAGRAAPAPLPSASVRRRNERGKASLRLHRGQFVDAPGGPCLFPCSLT